MATFSVIKRSALEGSLRIDAQYYQEKYISNRNRISRFKCVRLGDISSVFRKGIFDIKASSYTDDGIPFVRIINLKDGLIDDSEIVHIPVDIHLKESKTALTKGDIILSKTAYPAASLVTLDICNTSQDTIAIKLSDFWRNKLYSGYLVAFLNSFYGLLLLEQWFQGNIQMHLSLPDAKRVLIPIFKEEYQQIIDNMWWEASKKRELAKLLYCQAEQILLSELGLLDWKPRRTLTYVRSFNQVAKASRMDAEHFHPKYKEMFDRLPSNVYLQLLGKITLYTKGIEVGSSAYTESGIPFLRVSNLSKHGIVDDTVNFISNELYNVLREKYEPQQGEILLSKDATPGIAYFLDESVQGIIASGILRLSLIEDIPPYYLELVLNSIFVQLQIEQSVGGSIIKHWKPSQVQKTWIPRLLADREKEISALVQQSHAARREAKTLLEKAKRAVEIAIEYGEQQAMDFLCK